MWTGALSHSFSYSQDGRGVCLSVCLLGENISVCAAEWKVVSKLGGGGGKEKGVLAPCGEG